ncbi:helix-turn-helix domain-containing protein [Tatumella sp. UCD-D_suzukii]|uniref:helix-turn-helix domain-containing protein n=1 Tax=Tatumella sp. UCD-D_suzukii TaxID=1408192 RepID=UPI001F200CED|nr:helix-turn-helix transcriptional regulator [Tatumella sp. UCD-D_suzukii]
MKNIKGGQDQTMPTSDDLKHLRTPTSPERLYFAKRFREARKAANLSQRDVREKCGVSQSFVSDVENGKNSINIDSMSTLAKAVGVPLWKLLRP